MFAINQVIFKLATLLFLALCCVSVCGKNLENTRLKRTTNGFESNCENVKPFFQMRNITISSFDDNKGSVCDGECCDDKTETVLKKLGQKDFSNLLRHNSISLQGLLSSTATTLQNHVLELAQQSENKTLQLFNQVYRGMAILSREPIASLYQSIREYVYVNSTLSISQSAPNIRGSVTKFFTDLFPLVYHHSANTPERDFTLNYKSCLKKVIESIHPFGDNPSQIAQSLSKSLETLRALLQAFNIGSEVLNTTDTLLIDEHSSGNSECHDALLKMTYCPRCKGLLKNAKPCSGYCLNVLRGCITKYVAELDLPWNGYVDSIESLVNAMKRSNNVDSVIRNLDTAISNGIMVAMEKGKDIDNKVKGLCGAAEFSDKQDPLMMESSTIPPTAASGKPRLVNHRVFSPMPETELVRFLTNIVKTKGFYNNLADTLCQDESFAEPKDQRCWNGERIAEYTKTVVDVGLNMQKYNPEVKASTNMQNVDPRIADLVDKLRHVHHMAVVSLGSPFPDDYMQRDGADGSGSGSGPDFEDGDDEYMRGSGSGDGLGHNDIDQPHDSSGGKPKTPTNNNNFNTPPHTVHTTGGAASSHQPLISALLIILITFTISKVY